MAIDPSELKSLEKKELIDVINRLGETEVNVLREHFNLPGASRMMIVLSGFRHTPSLSDLRVLSKSEVIEILEGLSEDKLDKLRNYFNLPGASRLLITLVGFKHKPTIKELSQIPYDYYDAALREVQRESLLKHLKNKSGIDAETQKKDIAARLVEEITGKRVLPERKEPVKKKYTISEYRAMDIALFVENANNTITDDGLAKILSGLFSLNKTGDLSEGAPRLLARYLNREDELDKFIGKVVPKKSSSISDFKHVSILELIEKAAAFSSQTGYKLIQYLEKYGKVGSPTEGNVRLLARAVDREDELNNALSKFTYDNLKKYSKRELVAIGEILSADVSDSLTKEAMINLLQSYISQATKCDIYGVKCETGTCLIEDAKGTGVCVPEMLENMWGFSAPDGTYYHGRLDTMTELLENMKSMQMIPDDTTLESKSEIKIKVEEEVDNDDDEDEKEVDIAQLLAQGDNDQNIVVANAADDALLQEVINRGVEEKRPVMVYEDDEKDDFESPLQQELKPAIEFVEAQEDDTGLLQQVKQCLLAV